MADCSCETLNLWLEYDTNVISCGDRVVRLTAAASAAAAAAAAV